MTQAAESVHGDPPGVHYRALGQETALFEHAAVNRLPILIKGPTGCGKTRFVRYMAERLGRPLYTVACHDDLTASDLVGRYLIGAEGTFWRDGPLTRAVREGAICYLDEIVEARRDTTVVLHPLADDRRELPIEATGELLEAAPGFTLVVSYNPGYQNLLKGLKPSTRQRFVAMAFDYPDEDIEAEVVARESGIDAGMARQLVRAGTALRTLGEHDLEESVSTRLLVYAGTLVAGGASVPMACEACLVQPLSDDETTLQALREVIHAHLDT